MSLAYQSSPQPTVDLPRVDYGKGVYVYDSTGKQYLDGSGGPSVFCLGHGNEEVNAAITAQLERIAHGYRYTFSSDALDGLQALIGDVVNVRATGNGTTGGTADSRLEVSFSPDPPDDPPIAQAPWAPLAPPPAFLLLALALLWIPWKRLRSPRPSA